MTTNLLRTNPFGFQRFACAALIVGGPLSLAISRGHAGGSAR